MLSGCGLYLPDGPLSRLAQKLGLRFSIEIHPVNASNDNQEVTVTRLQAGGVELVVVAS